MSPSTSILPILKKLATNTFFVKILKYKSNDFAVKKMVIPTKNQYVNKHKVPDNSY